MMDAAVKDRRAVARQDMDDMDKYLMKLYREDPKKLDALESGLKTLRREAGAGPKTKFREVVDTKTEELRQDIKELQKKQDILKSQEENLRQLIQAGDQRSMIRFFEEQGLSRDEICRALTGDPSGALSAFSQRQEPNEEDINVHSASLELADKLHDILTTTNSSAIEDSNKPQHIVEKKQQKQDTPKSIILQPDFRQRKPTPTDNSLVLTVSLPRLAGTVSDVDLDIAEQYLRLRAPAHSGIEGKEENTEDKYTYMLNVPLARRVQPSAASAKWKSKQTALIITMPLLSAAASSP